MDIQAQTASTASTYGTNSASTFGMGNSSANMTSDMFYKLLAAQMQYQDPMESMDTSQMILQMSQFATIEALNNLNNQFAYFMDMSSIQIGSAMAGKEVTVGIEDEEGNATTITGVVEKVGFTSSGPVLQINGEYYEMWRVISVSEPGSGGSNNGGGTTLPEFPDENPEVLPSK